MEKEIAVYQNKVYGIEVSKHGLEHGYLDYRALAEIVGSRILNNTIYSETPYDDWELVCGYDFDGDETIYQYYIISEFGYSFLAEHTNEVVYYNPKLDLYLWGITHYGTGWDYVLTDVKLITEEMK